MLPVITDNVNGQLELILTVIVTIITRLLCGRQVLVRIQGIVPALPDLVKL